MIPKDLASGEFVRQLVMVSRHLGALNTIDGRRIRGYRDVQRRRDEYGNNDTTLDRHERPPLVSATFGPETTDEARWAVRVARSVTTRRARRVPRCGETEGKDRCASLAQDARLLRAPCARACATARATPAAPRRCQPRRERAASLALARRLLKGTSGTRTTATGGASPWGRVWRRRCFGTNEPPRPTRPNVLTLLSSKMEE